MLCKKTLVIFKKESHETAYAFYPWFLFDNEKFKPL
jgi:hypothetical protein